MADKNIIVNPIKTQPTVNRAIATPNVSKNMGIERRAAETMDKILYEMDDIKTKNEIIGGEAAYAEVQEKVLEYQSMVRHNKEYYQDGTKLAELQSSIGEIKDKYRKMAQNNGYDMRFVNAYVDRMEQGYKASEQVFYQKFAEYSKKLQADNYLLVMDKKSKNNLTLAGIGDINGALDNYKENVDNLLRGQKEGFISMSELINAAGNLKNGIFHSYVNSFIDDPDGIEKLNAMANYTDEQINQIFEGFNFEKDGYLSVNTPEDFESFRRSVARAVSAYETKRKAQEEATLYEATKQIQYRKENNFAIESKNYSANIPPNQIGQRLYTNATNNYYNLSFKNIQQSWDSGRAIQIIDASNSQEKFYNDPNISGIEIALKNVQEYQMYAGGWVPRDKMIVKDSMSLSYRERGVGQAFGYSVTENLLNAQSETSQLINRVYSPEARKLLAKMGDTKLNVTGVFKEYEDRQNTYALHSGMERTNISAPYNSLNKPLDYSKSSGSISAPYGAFNAIDYGTNASNIIVGNSFARYTPLTAFGKLKGIEYLGEKGDLHWKATSEDLNQLTQDTVVTAIIQKYGGVLPEKIAKKIDAPGSANMFFMDLSTDVRKEAINYIFQNDEEIIGTVEKMMTPVINETLGDTTICDAGNGRFFSTREKVDEEKVSKAVFRFTEQTDFYLPIKENEDGTWEFKKVRGKEVIPVTVYDPEKQERILFTYGGQPLYLNGKQATVTISEVLK